MKMILSIVLLLRSICVPSGHTKTDFLIVYAPLYTIHSVLTTTWDKKYCLHTSYLTDQSYPELGKSHTQVTIWFRSLFKIKYIRVFGLKPLKSHRLFSFWRLRLAKMRQLFMMTYQFWEVLLLLIFHHKRTANTQGASNLYIVTDTSDIRITHNGKPAQRI